MLMQEGVAGRPSPPRFLHPCEGSPSSLPAWPCRPLAVAAPASAHAATAAAVDYVPGEVVVRYEPGADRAARAAAQRAGGAWRPRVFAPRSRVLKVRDGASVEATARALRRRPGVASATPNWIARTSFVPNDPGFDAVPGGWQNTQWNFGPAVGVNAPAAWDNLIAAGRPGGRGSVIAVLDTGRRVHEPRPLPPLAGLLPVRFLRGYDFVDRDRYPNDQNGHGTHVAGTIGETVNNGAGVTGLAYGARIIPVRVLDRLGEGDSSAISAGIRYAARRGADVDQPLLRVRHGGDPERHPGHPRGAALRAPQGDARRRRLGQRGGDRGRLPRPRGRGARRSAPPPSTSARPTTRTTAPGSTSPRPAAARTPPSPARPTAAPTSRPAATSSR